MGRLLGLNSDVGNKRTFNEDAVGYWEDGDFGIYVVADGMGGHNAGEVASMIAKDTVIEFAKEHKDDMPDRELLENGLNEANRRVYREAIINEECKGMGTTIVVALIRNNDMVIANVGDSRAYVMSGERLERVTKDHSLVQELVDSGTITMEEAENHPNKNVITRAVGTNISVQADYYTLDISQIDKIILCSDGLTNEVGENEIVEILSDEGGDKCLQLINRSKENGGRDNISVIILKGECTHR